MRKDVIPHSKCGKVSEIFVGICMVFFCGKVGKFCAKFFLKVSKFLPF